jgi:hypothetical protein
MSRAPMFDLHGLVNGLVSYPLARQTSFREASRAMHSDVRYDTVSNGLSREDRERVYTEHRDEVDAVLI